MFFIYYRVFVVLLVELAIFAHSIFCVNPQMPMNAADDISASRGPITLDTNPKSAPAALLRLQPN